MYLQRVWRFAMCGNVLLGVPVILNRISFSGELGYEIYCKPQYLSRLSTAIEEAGAELDIVGMARAR